MKEVKSVEGRQVMTLWKTIDVAENERALVFRKNRLEKILEPGHHEISQLNGRVRYDLYQFSDGVFVGLVNQSSSRLCVEQ